MNCKQTESLMVDFLYGELSNDLTKEFYQHLHECDKCSGNLNDLVHLRKLLKEIPEITDPAIKWKSPHWVNRMKICRLKWYLAAAAVIVLTSLSLFVVFNTSFHYEQGVIALKFGTEKQAALPESGARLTGYDLTTEDVEKIFRYINYLENKQHAERIILTEQLENLASSTLHEFQKRDKMLHWLISYSNLNVEPASSQER